MDDQVGVEHHPVVVAHARSRAADTQLRIADAIAAEAERLGGKVIVPPFDSEPVRMTVLADPQGAVFTASKFQPRES